MSQENKIVVRPISEDKLVEPISKSTSHTQSSNNVAKQVGAEVEEQARILRNKLSKVQKAISKMQPRQKEKSE
jgi:hypothetical protein